MRSTPPDVDGAFLQTCRFQPFVAGFLPFSTFSERSFALASPAMTGSPLALTTTRALFATFQLHRLSLLNFITLNLPVPFLGPSPPFLVSISFTKFALQDCEPDSCHARHGACNHGCWRNKKCPGLSGSERREKKWAPLPSNPSRV